MLNPYPKLPPLERLQGVVERASKQPVTRDEYEAWTAAKDTLERAAPVIASDLIAAVTALDKAQSSLHAWLYDPTWPDALGDDAYVATVQEELFAALSTVLAHIDDSLPEVDHHHQVAANAARPSIETEPPPQVCRCGHERVSHFPASPGAGDVPGTLATCSVCLDAAVDAHRAKKPSTALFEKCRHDFATTPSSSVAPATSLEGDAQ